MIELDAPATPAPRRSRTRLYLAAAAAVLLLAGAAVTVAVLRSGGDELRLEVSSESGTALQIQWNVGMDQHDLVTGESAGEPFPVPWSTTVKVEDVAVPVTLMVMSSETDTVSCRILANGEVVAEGSNVRAFGCVYGQGNRRFG